MFHLADAAWTRATITCSRSESCLGGTGWVVSAPPVLVLQCRARMTQGGAGVHSRGEYTPRTEHWVLDIDVYYSYGQVTSVVFTEPLITVPVSKGFAERVYEPPPPLSPLG